MKRLAALFLAATLGIVPAGLAETALSAFRALPKTDAANLVRISSQDGAQSPGQWFFTVYDAEAPSHLRELAVVKGEVVATRDVPPGEAAALPKEPVVASDVKIDSDRAGDIALASAAANRAPVGSMTYDLRRQGRQAVPVWIVQCHDASDRLVGSVVVTASRGNIIASDGFPIPASATIASVAAENEPPASPKAAGIPSQVIQDDQQFLASQSAPTPPLSDVASPAVPERSDPIASRVDPKPAKAPRNVAKDRSPYPPGSRVTTTTRTYTESDGDDFAPPTFEDRRDRDDETYERRRRYDDDRNLDEAVSSKIHRVRTFIHRLLPF